MAVTADRSRNVVFGDSVHRAIQRGIHQMVAPIRPTLGPIARTVAMSSSFPGEAPELLDKGSIIARRIVSLPDRDADMGAMLVRGLLWRLHQSVGDCTATAAVLCQAVYDGGLHYLAAGGDAMHLRHYLETGVAVILAELDGITRSVSDRCDLINVAETVGHDPKLAKLLGEILDTLGPYAQIDVRNGHGRETTRQYVEGAYWKAGVHTPAMLPGGSRVELVNPAVLLTDLSLDTPHQVAPAIEAALRAGKRSLVIVANKVSESVTAFLLANRDAAGFNSLAVKIPEPLVDRPNTLADLAALIGGRPLLEIVGDTLDQVTLGDLGGAALAWADKDYLGFVEGMGDKITQTKHLATLQTAFDQADEPERRKRLLERLSKFVGGSAIIWVGGTTDREIKMCKARTESTAAALRTALFDGVVPGGGAALLACQPALFCRLANASSLEERAAYNILLQAVEVPFRTIVANAGYDPAKAMAALRLMGNRHGFNVMNGQISEMAQEGIWDVATAYKAAVQGAVTTAAIALTVDVLVHSAKPEQVIEPE